MNYATGHAMSTDEIFLPPNDSVKKTLKKNKIKLSEAIQVFKACVRLVIDDMIDNNVTFQLPTGTKYSELYMRRIDGEEFTKCRQNGRFQDVDFLTSNFTAYEPTFKYQNGGVMRDKKIYFSSTDKNRIIDHINNGKNYY